MIIVKLGGSMLTVPELRQWLAAIATQSDGHVVIVPGGGLYADAVRQAQMEAGFDDKAAHRLAVMAMDQYGQTLAALEPRLVTAESELELAESSWQHRGIIWLPSRMVLAEDSIPATWDMSSDSLSAWLAGRIKARHLILVKSLETLSGLSLQDLTEQGVVDPLFPQFAKQAGCPVLCVGKAEIGKFAALLKKDVELID